MKEVQPSVSIISHTENPLETIYRAARQCYSAGSVADMEPASREKMAELVQRCIRSGHTSVLEHVSFTFAISGVSRALSHQLVRHRMASHSQQSQRYVKADELEYVCPFSMWDKESAGRAYFIAAIESAAHAYQAMLADGVPAEDARFVLPAAVTTNVVMTMNCRELLHFLEERCCARAQWEIRSMAWTIRERLVEILPEVFVGRGPKCRRLGYCPEEQSCGEYPKQGEQHDHVVRERGLLGRPWRRKNEKGKKRQHGADRVNHPYHYCAGGVECIEGIKAALGSDFVGYCQGNVLKYVWRWKLKGGVEDLKKAQVYLGWMIEAAEGGK